MNKGLEITQDAHFKSIFFFSNFVVTLSGVSLTRDEILNSKSDVSYTNLIVTASFLHEAYRLAD